MKKIVVQIYLNFLLFTRLPTVETVPIKDSKERFLGRFMAVLNYSLFAKLSTYTFSVGLPVQ